MVQTFLLTKVQLIWVCALLRDLFASASCTIGAGILENDGYPGFFGKSVFLYIYWTLLYVMQWKN